MTIDNFDLFRSKLTFKKAVKFDPNTGIAVEINDTYDRYVVQILKRAKDPGGKTQGVNTGNRLIKTYEISSLEYFDKKREHIIDLCRANGARAYILPQVRSTYDCLKEMIKIGVDNLENPTIKFQHILRSCLCSMHKSRDKMWILDLDSDCMREYLYDVRKTVVTVRNWTPDEVMTLVRENLEKCGKNPDRAYFVKTRSGCHIITPPFNLQAAVKECSLMYEGEKTTTCEVVWTGPGEFELKTKKITGWLHKDGMSLLYYDDGLS